MSDYGGDDEPMDYGVGEEQEDNLIEENDFLEQDLDAGDNNGNTNDDGNHNLDSTDFNNDNIVAVGDTAQEKAAKLANSVRGQKEKKIDDNKRNTTPYMTKYERARVLGTRALQIR
jgi:DNA-directed RNA polymerase I, II, and III subunit RPABC2